MLITCFQRKFAFQVFARRANSRGPNMSLNIFLGPKLCWSYSFVVWHPTIFSSFVCFHVQSGMILVKDGQTKRYFVVAGPCISVTDSFGRCCLYSCSFHVQVTTGTTRDTITVCPGPDPFEVFVPKKPFTFVCIIFEHTKHSNMPNRFNRTQECIPRIYMYLVLDFLIIHVSMGPDPSEPISPFDPCSTTILGSVGCISIDS